MQCLTPTVGPAGRARTSTESALVATSLGARPSPSRRTPGLLTGTGRLVVVACFNLNCQVELQVEQNLGAELEAAVTRSVTLTVTVTASDSAASPTGLAARRGEFTGKLHARPGAAVNASPQASRESAAAVASLRMSMIC
jgi:hypothetical protein